MDMNYYMLKGHVVVNVGDIESWARAYESQDRRVAITQVGELAVSTVFLGTNHEHDPTKPPLLFETMIFGEPYDNWCWRTGTWDEAEVMHERIVADLQAGKELTED